jgi:prepilin-type N-terminal cleavage/methylation domain-containing protein
MTRRSDRSESGFTLVEVMVAMSILLIGVLGTVTMIDGANAGTSRTKAREGGTALARSVLEIARAVPYRELTAARVLTELDGHSGLADAKPGQSGHQIVTRGFTYTVTPTACALDDPK